MSRKRRTEPNEPSESELLAAAAAGTTPARCASRRLTECSGASSAAPSSRAEYSLADLSEQMSAPASILSGSKSARGNIDGVDRLSSLSDDLLHQVMSFLSMPEVVRTSLLSPRWRNLWASTPFVYIDHQDFKDENEPSFVDKRRLEKFGDNLLLLRDGTVSLDEACIIITGADSRKSSVWIRHAINHKARILYVSGFDEYPSLDGTAMFPSQHLKRIRLQHVSLRDRFVKPINHDCPVLEHLELESCILYINGISSSSLKVLRIIHCVIDSDLLISARNLTHLSVIDPIRCGGAVVTRDLSSLVSALISLRAHVPHDIDDTEVDHHLLDGLSHATMLELHAPLPELAFERCLQACPTFSNLTRLVLGDWCMALASDIYPLFHILHRCPKLKELTVKLHMENCEVCKKAESVVLPPKRALSIGGYPHVKRIKICCIKDDPRIGSLVQTLVPIFIPDGKIIIEGHQSIIGVNE